MAFRVSNITKDYDPVQYPSREQSYNGTTFVVDTPGLITVKKDPSVNTRVNTGTDKRIEDSKTVETPATRRTTTGTRTLNHGRVQLTEHGQKVTNTGSDTDSKSGSDLQIRSGTDKRITKHGDQTTKRNFVVEAEESGRQTQQSFIDRTTSTGSGTNSETNESEESRSESATSTRNVGARRSVSVGEEDIGIQIAFRVDIQNRQPILIE